MITSNPSDRVPPARDPGAAAAGRAPLLVSSVLLFLLFSMYLVPVLPGGGAGDGSSSNVKWASLSDGDGDITVDVVFPKTHYRDREQEWTVKVSGNLSGNYTLEISVEGLPSARELNITAAFPAAPSYISFEEDEFTDNKRDAVVELTLSRTADSSVVDSWNGSVNIFEYSPPPDSDETGIGYLYAAYTVIWAGLLAYVFIVDRQFRHVERDIANLAGIVGRKGRLILSEQKAVGDGLNEALPLTATATSGCYSGSSSNSDSLNEALPFTATATSGCYSGSSAGKGENGDTDENGGSR